MSATGNPPNNKRVRFDKDKTQQVSMTTPMEAAECVVVAALAANGSLQELQKTYICERFSEFMKLKKTLNTFNDRLQLLQKPGYVASSCDFKFELNPTDRLLADDEAKVEKLHDEVNIARVLFQGQMQAQIIALVKLEIASVQNSIRKSVAKSIVDITTTLALLDTTLEEGHNSDIFQFVLDTDTADLPSLLQHSEFQTKHKLYDLIHTFAQEQATATTPTDAYRPTEDRTYAVDNTLPTVISFLQIFQAVFVTSWDTYLNQIALLENTKKVKAYLSASTAEKATQDTAMALADLDLNDPVTVKNVIDKSVAERTKQLERKLQQVQQVLARNSNRGANKKTQPGALSKNKKGSSPRSNTAAKADDADNGSSSRNSASRKKSKPRRKRFKKTSGS